MSLELSRQNESQKASDMNLQILVSYEDDWQDGIRNILLPDSGLSCTCLPDYVKSCFLGLFGCKAQHEIRDASENGS